MGAETAIGWCDATFNPLIGCTKVSEGCKFCYAESAFDHRLKFAKWGKQGTRVVTSEANWKKPLNWNRKQHDRQAWCSANSTEDAPPFRVFCASLADVFEDFEGQVIHSAGLPMFVMNEPNGHPYRWAAGWILDRMTAGRPLVMADVRKRLFRLIDETPEIVWMLLTKRPENIERMWPAFFPGGYIAEAGTMNQEGPRPNVWLGTSIEDQQTANERVPHLLKCKPLASKLFLSAEPLLGPIDLALAHLTKDRLPGWPEPCRVDWVIAGCESGPQRRPMQLGWCESMLAQCKEKGVAFFMKQMEIDGKVETDVAKFPEPLGVQEFPGT